MLSNDSGGAGRGHDAAQCGSVSGDHEGFCLKAADMKIKKRKFIACFNPSEKISTVT